MNKQISKWFSSMLQKSFAQRFGVFVVALLVIGAVSYFGATLQQGSQAAVPPPNALYLSPDTGSLTSGATFTTTIRSTTGSQLVNAVQASLTYNPAQLQFVSLIDGAAFPTVAATSTSTPGVIRVGRATSTPVAGDNPIVTITFKVLAAPGTPSMSLAFDPAFSFIVRSSDNTNIMTSSAGASYAVSLPAPTVSSVTPTSGPLAGGTVVTLTGTNFVSGATVRVGTTAATAVTYLSATSLRATVPAQTTAGAQNIVVTNSDSQSTTLTNGFTYIAPPTISSVSPVTGPTGGGTIVTLTGTNFATGTTVSIGGVAATAVTVASSTSLTATTAAHAAGLADVVVNNVDGQKATRTGGFTYANLAPTVTSISPNSGFVGGGHSVTISGANFISGASVNIGVIAATNVVFVNSSTITAKVPAQATGVAPVTVINPDAQKGTLVGAFTYKAAGDVNGDGRVNAIDLSSVISHDAQNFPAADFNADGTVGSADMAMLLAAWTW